MDKYDLAVIGGGLTGTAAAVCAARRGLKVILIEQSGSLTGAMGNCLVYPFMMYWTNYQGKMKFLSAGIFTEMRERQQKYQQVNSISLFSPDYFKFILDDMTQEAGVDVLFHAKLFEVVKCGDKISSVRLAVKSGVMEIQADTFIDATGDGDLFYLAGCDFRLGREADSLCQPMTTCFRLGNVNEDLFTGQEMARLQELYKKYQKEGKIRNPREDILRFVGLGKGVVHFNTTRVVKMNPTDPMDVSKAEIEARKQIREMYEFLKDNSEAFKESYIINIAADIGVRESRMLTGEYVLNSDDLVGLKMFDDRIALGNYDIDIHNPEGSGTSHYYFPEGSYYSIPYRCLVPKEISNMLVAGRCISVTHEAQASIRIMPICATLGEAAGVAAAVMSQTHTTNKTVKISEIQDILRANGAAID